MTEEAPPATVIATRRVADEGLPVRYLYREESVGGSDTGWRICSAIDEDEAYMENGMNLVVLPVSEAMSRFPEIVRFLMSPVGAQFERPPGADELAPAD